MSYLYASGGDNISLAAPIAMPAQHTVVAWVKPSSLPASLGTLFASYGTLPIFALFADTIRVLEPFSGSYGDWHTPTAYALNQWIAIAITFDGSSSGNAPSIYTRLESDPALASLSVAQSVAPSGTFVPTADTWYSGGILSVYGLIGLGAHLQIFNRVLNSTERNAAVDAPGSVTSGLVLWWDQQDDPSIDHTADDSSGNGYNGVVNGGVTLSSDNPVLPIAGFSQLVHGSGHYPSVDAGVTIGPYDTRGAKVIVATVSGLSGGSVFTDDQGNVWTPDGFSFVPETYHCINPNTSATHHFSVAGAGLFASVAIAAYSCSSIVSLDQKNQHTTTGPTASISTGSVTPGFVNELLVGCFWHLGAYSSIDSGFSKFESIDHPGGGQAGLVMADLIETAADPQNPTVTLGASTAFNTSGIILTFVQGSISSAIVQRRSIRSARIGSRQLY